MANPEHINPAYDELDRHEIVQIKPPHKWGGCLAVVSEVKSWGCQAYVSIPANDGTKPGQAYIRLNTDEFVRVGVKAQYVPEGEKDERG